MKFQTLFLIGAAAVPVLASAGAAGWEAVLFYDVYRMDGYRAESERTIAAGCVGSNKGRCDFIEFLNHIDKMATSIRDPTTKKKQTVPKVNPATVPATLDRINPDRQQAAGIGDWLGRPNIGAQAPGAPATIKNYDGSYDGRRLLGSRYNDGVNRHGDVLSKLSHAVEEAKSAADAAGESKNLMPRITQTLDEIIFERTKENEGNLLREINENKKHGLANLAQGLDPKVVAYPRTQTNANGDTFNVLDTDRLMADISKHPIGGKDDVKNEDRRNKIRNAMTRFAQNYFTDADLSETPTSSGKTHHDTIISVQSMASKLKSLC